MSKQLESLRSLHTFLAHHSLYPLVLSSLLATAFLFARIALSHSTVYLFLYWNLFLAWIPYGISLWIAAQPRSRPAWLLFVPALLWLVFFPNAPYIVTDLWHLDERAPIPFWYDIGLFATFAWTGVFIGVASLSTMQGVIKRIAGTAGSWLFVLATLGLSGFGIYLGRFLGRNSWDLFLEPRSLLSEAAAQLAHPLHHPQPFGVTLMFAAFMFVCYLMFVSARGRDKQ